MRKLLLITYHFPPDAAVGAIRPAKLAKYLRRLGWKPYVLTVGESHVGVRDNTRLGDVVDVPVIRTRVWPTALDLALNVRNRIAPRNGGAPEATANTPAPAVASRMKRYLNSIFELPDKQIGWLIPAFLRAYRLVRSEGIDLVMTSSPPRTTALVGLLLSYATSIRLVTALRDPWFVPYRRDPWFTSLTDVAGSRSAVADRIE